MEGERSFHERGARWAGGARLHLPREQPSSCKRVSQASARLSLDLLLGMNRAPEGQEHGDTRGLRSPCPKSWIPSSNDEGIQKLVFLSPGNIVMRKCVNEYWAVV